MGFRTPLSDAPASETNTLPTAYTSPADKGTGAFQYFIKLVPTVHSLEPQQPKAEGASPQGGVLAAEGSQGVEQQPQLTSLVSQFAYTYKFRSLKGATEYHTVHHEGEEKDEDSKRADTVSSMLLPGLCVPSFICCFLFIREGAGAGGRAGVCVVLVRRLMNPSEVRRSSCVWRPLSRPRFFVFWRARCHRDIPFHHCPRLFLPTSFRRARFPLTPFATTSLAYRAPPPTPTPTPAL